MNKPNNIEQPQIQWVKKQIKEYLDREAISNSLLADKLNDEKKSIDECWKYVCDVAFEELSNNQPMHHTRIFELALEYYNDYDGKKKLDHEVKNGKVMMESEEEDEDYDEAYPEKETEPKKESKPKKTASKHKVEVKQETFDDPKPSPKTMKPKIEDIYSYDLFGEAVK